MNPIIVCALIILSLFLFFACIKFLLIYLAAPPKPKPILIFEENDLEKVLINQTSENKSSPASFILEDFRIKTLKPRPHALTINQ